MAVELIYVLCSKVKGIRMDHRVTWTPEPFLAVDSVLNRLSHRPYP